MVINMYNAETDKKILEKIKKWEEYQQKNDETYGKYKNKLLQKNKKHYKMMA